MKKIRLLIGTVALVTGCIVSAQALPFYDLVDFSGLLGGQLIGDGSEFTYSHVLDELTPPGQSLNNATLVISHSAFLPAEIRLIGSNWDVNGEGLLLGSLNGIEGPIDGKATSTFILSRDVLDRISDSTTWTLALKLQETTDWPDGLWLDKSELFGEYTPVASPVPEPASMMLVGSGLLGIGGFFIKRKA